MSAADTAAERRADDDDLTALEPKQPFLYLLASLVLPGLGTILLGYVRRGIAVMAAPPGVLAIYLLAVRVTTPEGQRVCLAAAHCFTAPGAVSPLWDMAPVMFVTALAIGVFSIVDGYRSAQRWNREHHLLPTVIW